MALITNCRGLLYKCIINSIDLVSSSARVTSAKFHKTVVGRYVQRPGPIDRTPETPGSGKYGKRILNLQKCLQSKKEWGTLWRVGDKVCLLGCEILFLRYELEKTRCASNYLTQFKLLRLTAPIVFHHSPPLHHCHLHHCHHLRHNEHQWLSHNLVYLRTPLHQITIIIIIMFLIKFTGRSPIPYFWESPAYLGPIWRRKRRRRRPHHELYYNFTVYPDILFKYFHKIDVGGDPD